jgi:hypothetical protein
MISTAAFKAFSIGHGTRRRGPVRTDHADGSGSSLLSVGSSRQNTVVLKFVQACQFSAPPPDGASTRLREERVSHGQELGRRP